MRRQLTIQYPAIQKPPAVIPPPSFGWFRQLAEPTRFNGGYPNSRFHAALVTSGERPWAYNQPATDNANLRWHRPFSEPLRFKGGYVDDGYAQALIASGEIPFPAVQPSLDARNTRWMVALAEPRRFPRDTRYGAVLPPAMFDPPSAQPPIDAQNVRWYRQWVDPPRILKDPDNAVQAVASGYLGPPAIQPDIDSQNARWFTPLSEPQRAPRDPRYTAALAGGETGWPFAAAFVVTPVVTVDAWYVGWQMPQTPRPRLPGGEIAPPAIAAINDVSGRWWLMPLTEPVRYLRDPRAQTALAASGVQTWPTNQAAADNANVNWHRALAEPRRFPRDPRYTATLVASGEAAWPAVQPAFDNANVTWHRPLSEPVRFPRDPRATVSLMVGGEDAWPTIQPALDNANVRWLMPLAEPARPRASAALTTAGETGWPFYAAIVVVPVVTVDGWYVAWQTAQRPPARPVSVEISPPVIAALNDVANQWRLTPLAEPQRFARNPRFAATLAASGEYAWPYAQPAQDAANTRWFTALAEPRRSNRDPRYAAIFGTDYAAWPFQAVFIVVVVGVDSWFVQWSTPLRGPVFVSRSDALTYANFVPEIALVGSAAPFIHRARRRGRR